MAEAVRTHPLAAKVARIALVFMLVFWSSLRVEYLAFGAVPADDGTAEQGALDDIAVMRVDAAGNIVEKSSVGTATGTQRALANGAALEVVDMSADDEPISFVAVPTWSAPTTGDVRKALFVEWESSDVGVASVRAADGVALITPVAAGTATITCRLAAGFAAPLGDAFATRPCEARFQISVKASEPVQVIPQVNAFQVLDAKSAAVSSDATITLSEAERENYAFGVSLVAVDGVSNEALFDYTSAPGAAGESLEAVSEGLLADLFWELVGEDGAAVSPDVATIDAGGVLSMKSDGAFRVVCSTWYAPSADRSPAWSASVHVKSGDVDQAEEDLQGPAHPQDSLHVYANLGSATQKAEDGTGEGEGRGDSGSVPGSSSSAAGESEQTAGDDQSSGQGEGENASEDASAPENVIVEKTYGLEELQGVPSGTETYTVYTSSGATTVTGTGPYLVALLQDAGIPDDRFQDIESLSVTDYRGVTTKVSWEDLMRPRSYFPKAEKGDYSDGTSTTPMVAVSSYVNEKDDEGPADASKLLDNTRLRLLFGSTNPPSASIDALSLRSINDIVVNMKGAEITDKQNDVFSVSVDYVPVPLGATAVFSAIPSKSIGSARFDFQWQESADGGKTWADAEGGSVQTLRRVTSSENLGKLYRVILDSNMPDEDKDGEFLSATSDPVAMEAGDGFAVILAYDPPIAGKTALFQSSVLGGVDPGAVEYVWEMSEDGGASWQVIPNRTGPSLAVPTEPISEDEGEGGDSDDSGAGLIYIRVRAIAPDERVAVSNAQPLTVHVGDENSDVGGKDDDGRADGDDNPPDDNPSQPDDQQTTPPAPSRPSGPKVTEIDNVVIEQSASTPSASLDPNGTRTPAPAPSSSPTEIYVNEAVSEQVVEQVEQMQSTVPGARWTSLNTIDPTGDDVRRILADNPFAPFVVPFGLGVTAAGGVEKLVAFRRQTK